jgi:hypothetical protein
MLAVVLLALGLQERKAIPDDAALKEAEKTVRDLFKDDFAKKTPADKRSLAKKLLVQGRETNNTPASQYALLTMAIDLGIQSVDLDTCVMAMTELSNGFAIDVVAQRTASLGALTKVVKTPDDLKALAKAYLQLADEAMKVDRYDDAAKVADAANAQAKRGKELAVINAAEGKSKEVAAHKARFEKVRKARETLAALPDDPAANLAVGQYYCFSKNDWAGGLPLLAKSPDGPLKALALKDAGNPETTADRAAVGDGWWDLAETAAPEAKFPLHERAGYWYQQALAKLAGLDKKKVEQRLIQLNGERLGRGNWVELNDPALFGEKGKFGEPIEITVPKTGRSVILNSKPFPPGEYDALQIRIRFKDKGDCSFGYTGPGYSRLIDVGLKASEDKLFLPGEKWPTPPMYVGPLPVFDEYLITVINTKGEDIVYFNGQEIRRWPNPQDHFDQIRLWTSFGTVQYDKIRVRKR